jgi:hypothetical protein
MTGISLWAAALYCFVQVDTFWVINGQSENDILRPMWDTNGNRKGGGIKMERE